MLNISQKAITFQRKDLVILLDKDFVETEGQVSCDKIATFFPTESLSTIHHDALVI